MASVNMLGAKFGPQRPQNVAGPSYPAVSSTKSEPSSRQDLVDALEHTGRGDQAAFRSVYEATSAKLFGIILRILGRRDVAEEILQEVYIRVWQRAGDYDPSGSSPITWLATIARNRALDEAKRKTMRSLDDCQEVLEVPSDDNPLATHEKHEDARRLLACLDRLDPERKELVLLVYYYGMTREEISSRINRPVATVKTRLRRSLMHIRDCLGQ